MLCAVAALSVLTACDKTKENPEEGSKYELAPIEAYVEGPGTFHCGRAQVKVGQKSGYMNRKGELVIPCIYNSVSEFSEGYAYVTDSLDRCLYIDTLGNVVAETDFELAWSVNQGIARGKKMDGPVCYIEMATGKKWQSPYNGSFDYSDGMALVYEDRKYGFMDLNGVQCVAVQYDWAGDYSEGLAAVGNGNYSTVRYGYIDKDGHQVIEPQYNEAKMFTEGKAFVSVRDENYNSHGCYIDHEGKVLFDGMERGEPFCEGVAVVANGSRYNVIDATGKLLFDEGFSLILSRFRNGINLAARDGKWMVIDTKGNVLCADLCSFAMVNDPQLGDDGTIVMQEGTIWVVKDAKGNLLLPLNPEDAPEPVKFDEVKTEKPDPSCGEVWTWLGGTYMFWDGSQQVNVSVDEEMGNYLSVGDLMFRAEVDEATGRICAFDADDRMIFCGYLYEGGNALGGNLGGNRIMYYGVGD